MQQLSDAMYTLLPVIVGGLIGLAGGFIGPWFLQKAKEASERKKHRAEKFEELGRVLMKPGPMSRFSPKTTESPHHSKMTQSARNCNKQLQQIAASAVTVRDNFGNCG